MRVNVNNMDGEMRLLKQNMELITAGSSRVNTSLVEKRNRINQLSNVHALLRKVCDSLCAAKRARAVFAAGQVLVVDAAPRDIEWRCRPEQIQFVFELPGRLRKCLEVEEYGEGTWPLSSASQFLLLLFVRPDACPRPRIGLPVDIRSTVSHRQSAAARALNSVPVLLAHARCPQNVPTPAVVHHHPQPVRGNHEASRPASARSAQPGDGARRMHLSRGPLRDGGRARVLTWADPRVRIPQCVRQIKSNQLTECVQILLGLRENPSLLWKEYLRGQRRLLTRTLEASTHVEAATGKSVSKSGSRGGINDVIADGARDAPAFPAFLLAPADAPSGGSSRRARPVGCRRTRRCEGR